MTSNITNFEGKRAGRYVGTAQRRIDGRLKVTGGAKYAGEFPAPGLTYGYVISSDIAHGRITRIDTSAAEAVPGVIKVFTHLNRPKIASDDKNTRTRLLRRARRCDLWAMRRSLIAASLLHWLSRKPSNWPAMPRHWSRSTMKAGRTRRI